MGICHNGCFYGGGAILSGKENGDFGGHLTPGETYYFSITALYTNAKVPGNVVQLTYPAAATPTPTPAIIPATLRIEPEMLNLNSTGEFTAFITLPSGYDVNNIDAGSIVCEGAHAKSGHATGGGSNEFIAKFYREDLVGIVPGDAVTFTVTGKVVVNGNAVDFRGSDTIRVIRLGNKGNKPFS